MRLGEALGSHPGAVLGDLRGDIRAFLFTAASDDDFRARLCKGQRRSFSDTGGATGNKRYFVSIGVSHVDSS